MTEIRNQTVVVVAGPPGSGKSTVAAARRPRAPAALIDIDVTSAPMVPLLAGHPRGGVRDAIYEGLVDAAAAAAQTGATSWWPRRSRASAAIRAPGESSATALPRPVRRPCWCGCTCPRRRCSNASPRVAPRATPRSSRTRPAWLREAEPETPPSVRTSRWTNPGGGPGGVRTARRAGVCCGENADRSREKLARSRREPRSRQDASPRTTPARLRPAPSQRRGDRRRKAVNICRASRAHGVRPGSWRTCRDAWASSSATCSRPRGTTSGGSPRPARRDRRSSSSRTMRASRSSTNPGRCSRRPTAGACCGALAEELPGQRVVAASGSLPPGAPDDAYGRVVELARAAGRVSVIDAARAALRGLPPFEPDVVTRTSPRRRRRCSAHADEAVEADGGRRRAPRPSRRRGALRAARARERRSSRRAPGVAGAAADGCFWVGAPRGCTESIPSAPATRSSPASPCALERGDGLRRRHGARLRRAAPRSRIRSQAGSTRRSSRELRPGALAGAGVSQREPPEARGRRGAGRGQPEDGVARDERRVRRRAGHGRARSCAAARALGFRPKPARPLAGLRPAQRRDRTDHRQCRRSVLRRAHRAASSGTRRARPAARDREPP